MTEPKSIATHPGSQDSETPTAGTKTRVLVVEDSAVFRQIFHHFLDQPDLSVDIAENGQLGLERFKSAPYDVVVMDLQMPEMDGWTATRAIRKWEAQHRAGPPTPIIALTASSLLEDELRCRAAGCTSFLEKPVEKRALLEEIARVLNAGDTARRLANSRVPPEGALDPEIAGLVPQFLEEMRQKGELLIQAAQGREFRAAAELAHQVIGPGGCFGFPEMSNLGRALEAAAHHADQGELNRLALDFDSYVKHLKVIYG